MNNKFRLSEIPLREALLLFILLTPLVKGVFESTVIPSRIDKINASITGLSFSEVDHFRSVFGILYVVFTISLLCFIVYMHIIKVYSLNLQGSLVLSSLSVFAALLMSYILNYNPDNLLPVFSLLVSISTILLAKMKADSTIKVIKFACLSYVYLSLACLLIYPNFALQYDYSGIFSFRLHGISSHANQLALFPVIYIFLTLDTMVRTTKRLPSISIMNIVASLVVLLTSQSKTMLIVLVLFLIFVSFQKAKYSIVSAPLIFICVCSLLLLDPWLVPSLLDNDQVTTLTGRNDVWQYSYEVWRNNPIFGLGGQLWNRQMNSDFMNFFGWYPNSSHSQLFQSLAQSGIIGTTLMLIFTILFAISSLRLSKLGYYFPIGLFIIFIFRSITESYTNIDIYNESYIVFIMSVVFMSCINPQETISAKEMTHLRKV